MKVSVYHIHLFPLIFFMISCGQPEAVDQENLEGDSENYIEATLRSREKAGNGNWKVVESKEKWDPAKTAIIIVDMWDKHWCESASERVEEIAPVMNTVVNQAREKGIMIIHAPSGTMEAYKDYPQRKRAQEMAPHTPPENIQLEQWCYLDPDAEAALPIDDSDGGCDKPCEDGKPCEEKAVWSSQTAAIAIHENDFITDSGQEVYNIFKENGIENLIIMGVHTNMCVLGRPFAIRQMSNLGMNVVLMRDMTDAMYNPESRPKVDHFTGTDLVIEHIEKYWAPTMLSSDLTGKLFFRFKEDDRNL
ncbi:protein-signal peptide and transmembrane prediction [Negadavirga shengliensis]|uniref:Protein-signal peptide and transmembrane prediction n=1 Tax=Negadavirga shengliensis TaxID=1389218 RepID=A0ABV9SZB6_9BACT